MADEKQIGKLYGETHHYQKLHQLGVDLSKLQENQSVVWGDGKSYCWLLTEKYQEPKETDTTTVKLDALVSLPEIRKAIANYMRSEGCGCCKGSDHEEHEETIAKLLNVPMYKDGSGYDFAETRAT